MRDGKANYLTWSVGIAYVSIAVPPKMGSDYVLIKNKAELNVKKFWYVNLNSELIPKALSHCLLPDAPAFSWPVSPILPFHFLESHWTLYALAYTQKSLRLFVLVHFYYFISSNSLGSVFVHHEDASFWYNKSISAVALMAAKEYSFLSWNSSVLSLWTPLTTRRKGFLLSWPLRKKSGIRRRGVRGCSLPPFNHTVYALYSVCSEILV